LQCCTSILIALTTAIYLYATLLTTALTATVHRAKFSYTNYAGKFTVASGELSPGGRRHDTFTTHKATGKNKYRLPVNMNFTAKPKAAKMGPARVASAASIEEGNCDDYNDTNATTNNNANISAAFPGERSSVLQALGQRWRALLGAATVSSSGAAKRRRSSLKPFLSHAGDAPQSPTAAAAATQRSARVSVQEHPRTHNGNGISSRSSGSAQGFTALVPLSPVAAAPVAAAAVALAPIVLQPSNTLHNVMVEGHITSSDLQTHLAPLLARLFIEEQRKLRGARSGAAAATAAKPERADCYSSKNTVIVVSGPPGFSDQVDALLKSLAVPTHMVLFLD
jgi:hypothetical protein